jgi:hypothetical protein
LAKDGFQAFANGRENHAASQDSAEAEGNSRMALRMAVVE